MHRRLTRLSWRIFVGLCLLFFVRLAFAQSELLDHLNGHWVLTGKIEGKPTTHDIDAEWVLNRGYLRLHEVSREKAPTGAPQYEAIVLLSKNAKTGEYSCLWLDTTSNAGLSNGGIAHGQATETRIPFVFFPGSSQEFRNTFSYDSANDTWTWTMDGTVDGKSVPFARLKLTRK